MGAGAFGTALAISLAEKGPVTLWARDVGEMQGGRENTDRLPGFRFPDSLSVTGESSLALKSDIVLIAVPLQQLRSFLETMPTPHKGASVACCKGIDVQTGRGPTQILRTAWPSTTPAILTGPSFAVDIAAGLPTALTLACQDSAVGETLQTALSTSNLRLYRTSDTEGAEIGGALKNVIAIACGAAIGARFGESARAAVMTRGFAEMQRFAALFGADPRTLSGLSGFGDLTLTCTSEKSRNYRYGLALGAGEAFDQAVTVEGVATAKAVTAAASKAGVDMPITTAINAVITGTQSVDIAMQSLLSRPLTEE